jgi:hypothetical protein
MRQHCYKATQQRQKMPSPTLHLNLFTDNRCLLPNKLPADHQAPTAHFVGWLNIL